MKNRFSLYAAFALGGLLGATGVGLFPRASAAPAITPPPAAVKPAPPPSVQDVNARLDALERRVTALQAIVQAMATDHSSGSYLFPRTPSLTPPNLSNIPPYQVVPLSAPAHQ